jgi:hypothetical protein
MMFGPGGRQVQRRGGASLFQVENHSPCRLPIGGHSDHIDRAFQGKRPARGDNPGNRQKVSRDQERKSKGHRLYGNRFLNNPQVPVLGTSH